MSAKASGRAVSPANLPAVRGPSLYSGLIALASGLLLLGLLFRSEIVAAVRVWNDSTAYNHCFLIIPIVAYLVWDRRDTLRGMTAHSLPWAAVMGLPLAIIWLLAERLGIMEGRQLVVVTLLQVLVLSVLGWRLWWTLAGPLLYLYFLVPFGEFIVPALQDVTTTLVRHGLEILQVPAFIDGYVIEIPEGTFFIAEACAGLRFLIASIAFGCLYALMIYRSPGRRAAFILASIGVPIVANGLRAIGIIWLGHVLGSAQAAAVDHVVYGWLFFSFVIVLLILAGLPFREDDRPQGPPQGDIAPVITPVRGMLIAVLVLAVVAGVGPVAAGAIDRSTTSVVAGIRPLDLTPECSTLSADTVSSGEAADRLLVQRVVCDGLTLELRIAVFPARSTAAPVLAERRRLTRATAVDEEMVTTLQGPGDQSVRWRLVQVSEPAYAIASAIWINGEPAAGGLSMRLQMAWHSLTGGQWAPVVLAITPLVDWPRISPSVRSQVIGQLVAFLQTAHTIDEQVRSLSALH
jgi:exosortase A